MTNILFSDIMVYKLNAMKKTVAVIVFSKRGNIVAVSISVNGCSEYHFGAVAERVLALVNPP